MNKLVYERWKWLQKEKTKKSYCQTELILVQKLKFQQEGQFKIKKASWSFILNSFRSPILPSFRGNLICFKEFCLIWFKQIEVPWGDKSPSYSPTNQNVTLSLTGEKSFTSHQRQQQQQQQQQQHNRKKRYKQNRSGYSYHSKLKKCRHK